MINTNTLSVEYLGSLPDNTFGKEYWRFLDKNVSIVNAYGDLCKHLGIDSSTDHPDRYSNLFLNAYINRPVHAEYLKMIQFYSPLGIWHVFLYSINTNIYHFRSMKYRQYA